MRAPWQVKIDPSKAQKQPNWTLGYIKVTLRRPLPSNNPRAKEVAFFNGPIRFIAGEKGIDFHVAPRPLSSFTLQLWTSKRKRAGTTAQISGELRFGTGGFDFALPAAAVLQAGGCYEHKLQLMRPGDINELRLWHDGKDAASEWHLHKVALHDEAANRTCASCSPSSVLRSARALSLDH